MDLRYTHTEFFNELKKRGIVISGMDADYFYVDFSFLEKRETDNYLREPIPENDQANKKFLENMPYRDDRRGMVTVKALMEAREKIQAIKTVRGLTGWGLKDAKFFIDRAYNI